MVRVDPIPAFGDNYIWCLHNKAHAWLVDPGEAPPVLNYLQSEALILEGILITHHHPDHIGGVKKLLEQYPDISVIGPVSTRIPNLTQEVTEGEKVTLSKLDCVLSVLEVPAHTKEHIAYYGAPGLFCGDTLFSAGCGRLFEGTPEQMHHNLRRFAELPDQTQVFCAHEYTQSNNQFALAILQDDTDFKEHQHHVAMMRNAGKPTIPTTIGQEKRVNPFMRVHEQKVADAVAKHTQTPLKDEIDVFAAMRHWKDTF